MKKSVIVPGGKLAGEDAETRRLKELKERLIGAETIKIGPAGTPVSSDAEATITIPSGKLAVSQWYERNPALLLEEKAVMQKAFPDFVLVQLADGRLAWEGVLRIGVLGKNEWYIRAVYANNHPAQVMGSSVCVYLIKPDINELIEALGWTPRHLLKDSYNNLYLCTAEAGDVKVGRVRTTAASVIAWAVKWLMAFELVLTGDLTIEQFNTDGVI